MNLHYIRAAIFENTGVNLSLERTRDILIEEGMLTRSQANRMIFTGYGELYGNPNVPVVDEEVTKDLFEMIADEEELKLERP